MVHGSWGLDKYKEEKLEEVFNHGSAYGGTQIFTCFAR
jgi:hypothetical protein